MPDEKEKREHTAAVIEHIAGEAAEALMPDLKKMIASKLVMRIAESDQELIELADQAFGDMLVDAVGDALARYAAKWREDAAKSRGVEIDGVDAGVMFNIPSLINAEAKTRGIDDELIDGMRADLTKKIESALRERLKSVVGKPLNNETRKEIRKITSEVLREVFDEEFA